MHKISNVDEDARTGDCEECGSAVRLKFAKRSGPRSRGWLECNSTKKRRLSKRGTYLRSVGAIFERDELAEVLSIDRCENPACTSTDVLVVDHDHATGKLRGRLCGSCNRALGMLADDSERIRGLAEYLDRFPGRNPSVFFDV